MCYIDEQKNKYSVLHLIFVLVIFYNDYMLLFCLRLATPSLTKIFGMNFDDFCLRLQAKPQLRRIDIASLCLRRPAEDGDRIQPLKR
jgi:hypothetical protein